jgi:uncharacterized repeat protein (TIGR02543 family)
MNLVNLRQVTWLIVVLSALVVLISTHFTITQAIVDKPKMGINGNTVSQLDPTKIDYQDFSVTKPLSITNEYYINKKLIGNITGNDSAKICNFNQYNNGCDIENYDIVNGDTFLVSSKLLEGEFTAGQKIIYRYKESLNNKYATIKSVSLSGVNLFVELENNNSNFHDSQNINSPRILEVPGVENIQGNKVSFTIPNNNVHVVNVNNLLELKNHLINDEADISFSTATPPVFAHSINIKENKTVLNIVSKKRKIEISNLIERISDDSDVAWSKQEYEVILPIGASMPNNVYAKYDDGTIQNLNVTKISKDSFKFTGFNKDYFNRLEIIYSTDFTSIKENRVSITGNYKFSASIINDSEVDYNVWGVDYTDLIDEYVLDYDLNGAETGKKPDKQLHVSGDKIFRPTNMDYTKKGYIFNGWAESPSEYARLWNFIDDKMPSSNKTLYVNWLKKTYKVNYVTNSSETEKLPSDDVLYGDKIGLSRVPYKNGYEFLEWNTRSDLKGRTWHFASDTMPDRNVTLYAKYKQNSYRIKFMYNDERGVFYQQDILYGSKIKKHKVPSKQGYKFVGWNTNSQGNGSWLGHGDIYNVAEDVTVYAIWKK